MYEILIIFFIATFCFAIADVLYLRKKNDKSLKIRSIVRSLRNYIRMRNLALFISILGFIILVIAFEHYHALNNELELALNKLESVASDTLKFFSIIKFLISSSITWILLSVIMEVYALLSLIKWELIREFREKHLTKKQVEELFYKGTKYIIGFFVCILGIFFILATGKFFLSNQTLIWSFFDDPSPNFILLFIFYCGPLSLVMIAMISSYDIWPKVIFNYSSFPKKPNEVSLETIFKKKLIAVCIVILAISSPIFLVAIDKYHLF